MQAPLPSFTRITFQRGAVDSARFTPDGQTVVYSARWQGGPSEVFSQRLGSADARRFGLAGARVVAGAGAEMAVILAGGTLARVPLEGGSPREVLTDVADADWRRDGTEWAIVRVVEHSQRLECPIGQVLHETAGLEGIASPRLSPTGDRVAFVRLLWWAANLRGRGGRGPVGAPRGPVERLGGRGRPRLVADGREVWFSASRTGMTRAVHAVTLSGRERLVAFLHGPGFHCLFEGLGKYLFVHGIGITHDNNGMSDNNYCVGPFLAVARLLEEPFSLRGIYHGPVPDEPFAEERDIPETFLVRACPWAELYPVHLQVHCTCHARGKQRLARGAGLVRRLEFVCEAGVLYLTQGDIVRKTARCQDDRFFRFYERCFSGFFIGEFIAFFDLDPDNTPVLFDNEPLHLCPGHVRRR